MGVWPPGACPSTHGPSEGGRDCMAGNSRRRPPSQSTLGQNPPPSPPDTKSAAHTRGVQAEETVTVSRQREPCKQKYEDKRSHKERGSDFIIYPSSRGPGQVLGWE